jgi:hypothetical protein
MPRSALAAVALFVGAAWAFGACGSGNSGASSSTTTTKPSATTTTSVDQKVLADLRGYRDAYNRAVGAPNPQDPSLRQYMTGVQLQQFQIFVRQLADSSRGIKGSATDAPRIVSVQGTTAVVDDCLTGSGRFYDTRTGQDTGPAPAAGGVQITMQLEDGTWKVASATGKTTACP